MCGVFSCSLSDQESAHPYPGATYSLLLWRTLSRSPVTLNSVRSQESHGLAILRKILQILKEYAQNEFTGFVLFP